MWAWLRSPRGSTLTVTAVAAILALFWLAPWSKQLPHLPGFGLMGGEAALPQPVPAAVPAPSSTVASVTAPAASTVSPVDAGRIVPAPAPIVPAAEPPPPPAKVVPSFDVVRVEPSGATIVAGRGEPGSEVTLLDNGQTLAHATIDAGGQFALLPPDLGEGSHYLTLQSGGATAGLASKQGVAISVPKAGGTSRPMVAMLSPDQPVKVLSDGATPALGGSPGSALVAIQAIEASRGGRFTATGTAKAGSQSRLYLNGAFLADVTADKDGRWAVRVEKGMKPGRYVVRADQLESDSSKVAHRAEVPFVYPTTLGKGLGKQMLMAHAKPAAPEGTRPVAIAAAADTVTPPGGPAPDGASPASAVIQDLKLTTVSRGDSLWRISRKLLGRGIDYTEIYASNTNQIRDPALIYPGQIFVLPQGPAK